MRHLFLLLVAGSVAYYLWGPPAGGRGREDRPAAEQAEGSRGFVELPQGEAGSEAGVVIFAPPNCSSEEAQRADDLAAALDRAGVPYRRSSQFQLTLQSPDPDALARIRAVMSGPIPVVIVNGSGKANPSADDVIAEYRGLPE